MYLYLNRIVPSCLLLLFPSYLLPFLLFRQTITKYLLLITISTYVDCSYSHILFVFTFRHFLSSFITSINIIFIFIPPIKSKFPILFHIYVFGFHFWCISIN